MFSKIDNDGTRQHWSCWDWRLFLTDQFGRQRPNLIDRVKMSYSAEISQLAAKLPEKEERRLEED